MGFFNFFKRKEKKEKEKLNYSQIEKFLSTKKRNLSEKEEEIIKIIQENISSLIEELYEKLDVLGKVDISEKKEQPRLKRATLEGLDIFKIKLQEFIEDLKKVGNKDLEKIVNKLDIMFADFKKKSRISFEKATILIGKEMADVKECLGRFSTNLHKIIIQSEEEIKLSKTLKDVENIEEDINYLDEKKKEIEIEIKSLKEEIGMDKENIKKKKRKIEEIRDSEGYKKNIELKEKRKEKQREIEKNLFELKSLIDFKSLAHLYHTFEKEMTLIKKYKDNFRETFESDLGEFFIKNIKDNEEIRKKIGDIINLKNETSKIVINDDYLNIYEKEIIDNENSIEDLEKNIEKFKQKVGKIDEEIDSKKDEIKEILGKIDVELSI